MEILTDKTAITIRKVITDFIFHCQYEKNLNEKTIKAYRTDIEQFLQFVKDKFSERSSIYAINKDAIKEYIQYLSCFKAKTSKRKIATLKAMFNYFEFENDDFINPFRKIKLKLKEPLILPTVMQINEVKKILQLLYNEFHTNKFPASYKAKAQLRDIAIVELLFATGIRVSELCNLNCSDIDLKNGSIKVFGKGSKERIIQICQKEVLAVLNNYYKAVKPTSSFFINRLGRQISPQSVRLLIKRCGKLTGLDKKITPHTFRHTFATLLLEEDVDIKYIQNLLGHSSIATTQIYTHVNTQKQKQILSTKHPRRNFCFTKANKR